MNPETMKSHEEYLKDAIDGRTDGIADLQQRLRREIAAERRRSRFIFSLPRPLLAVAASLTLAMGAYILWQCMQNDDTLPVCPHAAKETPEKQLTPPGGRFGEDFILHPERYDRICHCSPRYSGNLR